MSEAIFPPRPGLAPRAVEWILRHPGLFTLLMVLPIVLWLGIVYIGALIALLMQSFFSIDEFSGVVVREPTLKTYAELLRPANFDIIARQYAECRAESACKGVALYRYASLFSPPEQTATYAGLELYNLRKEIG